jgi:hypothetical protein
VHWKSGCFFESCNVIFDEGGPVKRFERIILEPDETPNAEIATPSEAPQIPKASPSPSESDSNSENKSESESEIEELLDKTPTAPPPPPNLPIVLSHPKCNVRAPIRDNDTCYSVMSYGACKRNAKCAAVTQGDPASDPQTYAEAMARPDAIEWELACNDEKRMFENMGVYELVLCPTNQKIVGSKWVFKIK